MRRRKLQSGITGNVSAIKEALLERFLEAQEKFPHESSIENASLVEIEKNKFLILDESE